MDWIKVLNKHVLLEYSDLRDSEFVAWIKIMALTAQLEHEPSREQMMKYVHYKTLDSLQEKLNKHSTDLQYVLNKVLIDAQYVLNRKEVWKKNKQQYRGNKKNVSMDVSMDVSSIDKEKDKEKEIKEDISSPGTGNGSCPHQKIIALYHEILPRLPQVKLWTEGRKATLQSRWREDKARQHMDWWKEYFTIVKRSPFLLGENERQFRADLEWLIAPKNMPKVIEGKYLETKQKSIFL